MENIKTFLIGALVVIAGGLGIFAINTVPVMPQVGAVSSPDISSPYFSFGGVRQWAAKTSSLNQATTTVCAIQSPVSTSTLQFASIQETISTTTASTLVMAKAASAYATTTWLNTSDAISANAQYTLALPATTTETGIDKYIFAPSQWLVISQQGGVGTFSPTGTCQAVWIQN